jgi:hypothetical protein
MLQVVVSLYRRSGFVAIKALYAREEAGIKLEQTPSG